MISEARLGALAVMRGLATRRGALAATAAVTLAAAYFAVRVAIAWETTLPQAAREELHTLPDAAIVAVNAAPTGPPTCGPAADSLPADVRSAAVARGFTVDAITTSDSLSLSTLPGQRSDSFVKAYCLPSVRDHAVLDAGDWPGTARPGGAIPVAAPSSTLADLGLHVGSRLTLTDASTRSPVSLLVVGAFHRTRNPAGYWAWDQAGVAGVQFVGSYTLYDPFVVDRSAFASGALHTDSATLLVRPPTADGTPADLAALSGQATSIAAALSASTAPYYSLAGSLAPDLDALGTSVATARAQLLAACLLLGAVTTAGLLAAAGLLVGIGAGQDALRRARGAGRGHLVRERWAELVLLCAAAAAAVPAGFAAAHASTAAAWPAVGVVALLAVGTLSIRTLRPDLPADVAAARGRQASVAYGLRLGADVVLAMLAALALWQSSSAPLTGGGFGGAIGTNPVVAAAPALAVVAGAGLAGRLLPAAARLAERGASRARRLFTVFAFWQVGRTPLSYVLPALVSVAAVAGATFAVAQDASWRRSIQDQAAFSTGAQVVVTTAWGRSAGQGTAIAHAHGVLTATPLVRVPQSQGSVLLALDTGTAADTVLLRPGLASVPSKDLWRSVSPDAQAGVAIPGRPTALAVSARLSVSAAQHAPASATAAAPLAAPAITATVQDADGLVYQVSLGRLAADGAPHTLDGSFSDLGIPDYPLRLLRFDVSYTAPTEQDLNAALTVLSVSARPNSATAPTQFATGGAFSGWTANSSWNAAQPCALADSSSDTGTPSQMVDAKDTPDGGRTLDFSTGFGLSSNEGGPCDPVRAGVALSAASGKSALPILATAAYLSSSGATVGATVPIAVNGVTIPGHIVASLSAFPTAPATGSGALVVDLPALAAETVEQGGTLLPPDEWWVRTADGSVPPGLPVGDSAVSAAALAESLAQDPLSGAAPHILTLGAVVLVLIAALALGACLAATGRKQSGHEQVLAALGAVPGQRTAIRLVRNVAIVAPAALLGWGLGLLVARQLVPVFVVAAGGTAPVPPVLFTTRPVWSALAVALLLAIAAMTALDLRPAGPRRRRRGNERRRSPRRMDAT